MEQLNGGAHFDKAIFYKPNGKDFLIMVSNYCDGLESLTYRLSADMQIEVYNFRISSDSAPNPVNSLTFIKDGTFVRVIYALKEEKWQYYAIGDPLYFENTELYNNRIIKKRLNRAILIDYCAQLGINLLDERFWDADNALVMERIKW